MPVDIDGDEGEQIEALGDGFQKVRLLEVQHGSMQVERYYEY